MRLPRQEAADILEAELPRPLYQDVHIAEVIPALIGQKLLGRYVETFLRQSPEHTSVSAQARSHSDEEPHPGFLQHPRHLPVELFRPFPHIHEVRENHHLGTGRVLMGESAQGNGKGRRVRVIIILYQRAALNPLADLHPHGDRLQVCDPGSQLS